MSRRDDTPDRSPLSRLVNVRGVIQKGIPPRESRQGISEVTFFTINALASGIIGNVTYDALKTTVQRLVSCTHRGRAPTSYTKEGRELIARLAVQVRCAEVGLPVPGSTDPSEIQCSAHKSEYIYHLYYRDLAAKVVVPKGCLDGRKLKVTLYAQHDSNVSKKTD